MGFSGYKIPGHSGTSFKHRKAFDSFKEYDKRNISYDRERRNFNIHPKLAPKSYKEANRKAWINKTIKLPLFLIFTVLALYVLTAAYNSLSTGQSQWHNYYKTCELKQQQNAYRVLVYSGKSYLLANELQEAHDEFVRALKIYPYGVEARVQVTKLLIITCEFENEHCELARDNISFLKEMNYIMAGDLCLGDIPSH